jgi:hypothetical protein
MWSVGETLQSLDQGGHLPAGFDANPGIRSLFPAGQSDITISLLQKYLYFRTHEVDLENIDAQLTVSADGAGNWQLKGRIIGNNCKWAAGFVFLFSKDSTAHGFVATGDYWGGAIDPQQGGRSEPLYFWVQGLDPWIASHWPDAFDKDAYFYLWDGTGDSSPEISNAATKAGFTGLAGLKATTSVFTVQIPDPSFTGSPNPPSGLGPVEWDIPDTGVAPTAPHPR